MLRLAAKLVAFFWRRADGCEGEAGPPEAELAEGASRAGGRVGGRRLGAVRRGWRSAGVPFCSFPPQTQALPREWQCFACLDASPTCGGRAISGAPSLSAPGVMAAGSVPRPPPRAPSFLRRCCSCA